MPTRKQNFPEATLYERALSKAIQETLETLKERTGLPESWLSKFRNGRIKNPSVNRVEKILRAFDML